jgi:hypothetical protein
MLPWVSLALQPYWLGLQSVLFAWGVFCLVSVQMRTICKFNPRIPFAYMSDHVLKPEI